MKTIDQTRTNNEALDRFQSSVTTAVNPVLKREIIDGVLITGVVIATGAPTFVDHGLGRDPHYYIVKSNAAGVVFDDQDNNPTRKQTLKLNTSVNVTVDLWIF